MGKQHVVNVPKILAPPPFGKVSSELHAPIVCHHCSISGHTIMNCFKLHPSKQVFNVSQGYVSLLDELLKSLSFSTPFLGNGIASRSVRTRTKTFVFPSSQPKTHAMWLKKDPET